MVCILETIWVIFKKGQGFIYKYVYMVEVLFVIIIKDRVLFERNQRVEGFLIK